MSMQAAVASALPREFFVARTARNKQPVEEGFGERLARLRKARGYAQTEVGEILDLSQRMALGVSVEKPLGLKPVADKPARNRRMWRKLREIEELPACDRRAVIKLVDGLLARQKLNCRGTRQ